MEEAQRVVTVTINPAIDHHISIPSFTAGAVNRVQTSRLDPGGKGVNVASYLADFGLATSVTGFLGQDNDGIFQRFFAEKRIEDRFVRIAGQTRTGVKIIDDVRRQTTDINFAGPMPSLEDIRRLFTTLRELARAHEWFVLAGSVPGGISPEIYREMVRLLEGKRVLLDASGEGLRQAVEARPWLVKPNVLELEELVREPVDTPADIVRVARALVQRQGIETVVVSMGKEGAIFVEEREAVWAVPPAVEVKSTVGAGDAMVAGIVAGKLRGVTLGECARLATGFSTSKIARIGPGLPSVEAVHAAAELVTLRNPEDR